MNLASKTAPLLSICKAARSLLAWSQADLAKAAKVSIPTIKRLEAIDGPLGGSSATGGRILMALEAAGIEFIEENGSGPGVRIRAKMLTKQRK